MCLQLFPPVFPAFAAILCVLVAAASGKPVLDTGGEPDTFSCTFDVDWCGLEQTQTDEFDWKRQSGPTPTVDTGPDCDPLHCPTGVYAYIESSSPRRWKDSARLVTPLLHGEGDRCLQFYWHMHGLSMGSLMVKLRHLNGSEVTLWSRDGEQGRDWHTEKLDFHVQARLYQVVLEGVVGPSYQSDLALDNLDIWARQCHEVVHNDCSFERDLCSWQNEGPLLWQRNHGNTPTPGTGPSLDHNNSSMGSYLYVEASRTFPNDTARLRSGELSGNHTVYCLHFFYHMLGNHVGELHVLARGTNVVHDTLLWSRGGDSGDAWHSQSVHFTSPDHENFRIIFEARLAGGPEGDIAIDDVTVHAGQCESPQLPVVEGH